MNPSKSTLKAIFLLALPLIFSNIVSSASGIISMFFIAQINTEALAAGAVISSSLGLCMMMTVSILYSVSICIGHSTSGKLKADINEIVASGIGLALLISLPMLFIYLNIGRILLWMRQPLEVCQMTGNYFHGLALGLLPNLLTVVFNQFFMGIRKPRIILYFTSLGVLINSCLSYVMIFGYGPINPMGIYGAGLSASLTAISLLTTIVIYILFHPAMKKYQLITKKIISFNLSRRLFSIGYPISIQYTIELLAFSAITYFMGIIGTSALAAQQISFQLSLFLIMINMGMSQAGSILISHHQQSGSRQLIHISRLTLLSGASLMLLIGFFYLLFSKNLIVLYLDVDNPALHGIASLAQTLILITVISQFFDAGRNISAGLLRGHGDSKTSMWTSLFSCWIIGIPLSLVLAFVLHLGPVGLRLGMMTGIFFGCCQLLRRVGGLPLFEKHSVFKPSTSPFPEA